MRKEHVLQFVDALAQRRPGLSASASAPEQACQLLSEYRSRGGQGENSKHAPGLSDARQHVPPAAIPCRHRPEQQQAQTGEALRRGLWSGSFGSEGNQALPPNQTRAPGVLGHSATTQG